jgi:uncharacterized membrane protein HdeD (DUF308 family)
MNQESRTIKPSRKHLVAFWVTILRGILATLLGIALIFQPDKTRPMLVNFMGMFWLASGIMSLRWGASGQRARRRSLAAGVIGIIGGLIVLTRELARDFLDDRVVVYILGAVIVLTGLIHVFGGFRVGEETERQRSWTSLLLGIFEIVLGALLLTSPTEPGPGIFIAASIWAFIGGFMLFGDALRQRAKRHRQESLE